MTNFESRFHGVYSRDNFPKDGAYVINLDEYADVGTHLIPLYLLNNNAIYFDSFGVEHVLKKSDIFLEIKTCKKHIQNKSE